MTEVTIYSPVNGTAVPMSQVPDPVFSGNIMGQGVAVIPTGTTVVAPVDGEITATTRTNHAFCIRSEEGLDLLIHLGIDTVNLGGKGFVCYVTRGQKVKRGDRIMDYDLKLCKKKGLDPIVPCVVLSGEDFPRCLPHTGPVKAGETPILTCGTEE